MIVLYYIIYYGGNLIIAALIVEALLSWIVGPIMRGRPGFLTSLYWFLNRVTRPIVAPFRKLLMRFNTGPIDFSVFLAIIVIGIVQRGLMRIIVMFLM